MEDLRKFLTTKDGQLTMALPQGEQVVTQAREERMVRGLGRTTIVSRSPDGLPVTLEGLYVEASMLRNQQQEQGV